MLETILGVIVGLSILLCLYNILNNKFQLSIIKIEKAEEDIDIYLQKKLELLNRTRPIIKKELKLDDYMTELDTPFEDVNNKEMHNTLKNVYNGLFKTLDEHEKLLKSETLVSILESLNNNEEDIIGAIKFYNDTVVGYNQLIVSFPSKIIAVIKRYKKKDFYNNEKREIFEILNEK